MSSSMINSSRDSLSNSFNDSLSNSFNDNMVKNFTEEYALYLRDESRIAGNANSISFPQNEIELKQVLSEISASGEKITVQGARTGITGGAVPIGGHIMNMSKMNKITALRYDADAESFYVNVQPGVLLSDLNNALSQNSFNTEGWSDNSIQALEQLKLSGAWFFPPDPTETTATFGGAASCNSSGSRSFHYGSARNYISAMRVILPDCSAITLRRGEHRAGGRSFKLTTDTGKVIAGELPDYDSPNIKNASGYYSKSGMDIPDLFIGSEGTLGIITEIELKLVKLPDFIWGVFVFFSSEIDALRFTNSIRRDFCSKDFNINNANVTNSASIAAIEFFNYSTLDLLRNLKKTNQAFSSIPEIKPFFHTAIYIELHSFDEDKISEMLMSISCKLSEFNTKEEFTWLASSPREIERFRYFRHAVPEGVNMLIDEKRKKEPGLSKLSTDMAVPDDRLIKIMDTYNGRLTGNKLNYVIFGHIGNNNLHVNIIPENINEYHTGKKLYQEFAREVLSMGGTVSAEHGIGKSKVGLLKEMYGEHGIGQMRSLKKLFDPGNVLNAGNLF